MTRRRIAVLVSKGRSEVGFMAVGMLTKTRSGLPCFIDCITILGGTPCRHVGLNAVSPAPANLDLGAGSSPEACP